MCLRCCDNDFDIPICEICIDIQKANLIASERVKCIHPGCQKWATISRPCISAETPEQRVTKYQTNSKKKKKGKKLINKLKVCGCMANYCDEHINKCKICDKILCLNCADHEICWQDGKPCEFCMNILPNKNLHICEICAKPCCDICSSKSYGGPIDIWGGYSMCKSHKEFCNTCKSDKYKIERFKCQVLNCRDYSCIRTCQFESIINTDSKIYVCHYHTGSCSMCFKTYPLTNNQKFKFKDRSNINCCTNCYIPIQKAVNCLLLCLSRGNMYIPGDILDYIIKLIVVDQIV